MNEPKKLTILELVELATITGVDITALRKRLDEQDAKWQAEQEHRRIDLDFTYTL